MIKKFNKSRDRFYKINERIFASQLRVLDEEGKQIGILGKSEALEKAKSLGVDLVEIAPSANPPVARIIDFKKFLYQEEKKKREEKKKAKTSDTKEVRLGPFMDDHDLEVMVNRAKEFLNDNDKVKLVVRFTGRQMAHPEFGHKVMRRAIDLLSTISKVDKDPKFEGRQLITMLSPERKKNVQIQTESKKVSISQVQVNQDRQSNVLSSNEGTSQNQ